MFLLARVKNTTLGIFAKKVFNLRCNIPPIIYSVGISVIVSTISKVRYMKTVPKLVDTIAKK